MSLIHPNAQSVPIPIPPPPQIPENPNREQFKDISKAATLRLEMVKARVNNNLEKIRAGEPLLIGPTLHLVEHAIKQLKQFLDEKELIYVHQELTIEEKEQIVPKINRKGKVFWTAIAQNKQEASDCLEKEFHIKAGLAHEGMKDPPSVLAASRRKSASFLGTAAMPIDYKRKNEGEDGSSKKKRAPSAYILFSCSARPKLSADNPEATFGEVTRILGQIWKTMRPEEKRLWEEKAAEKRAEMRKNEDEEAENDGEVDGDAATAEGREITQVELSPSPPPVPPFPLDHHNSTQYSLASSSHHESLSASVSIFPHLNQHSLLTSLSSSSIHSYPTDIPLSSSTHPQSQPSHLSNPMAQSIYPSPQQY